MGFLFYCFLFCVISIMGWMVVPILLYVIIGAFFVWLIYGIYCSQSDAKQMSKENEIRKAFEKRNEEAKERAENSRVSYKREGFEEWSQKLFAGDDSE